MVKVFQEVVYKDGRSVQMYIIDIELFYKSVISKWRPLKQFYMTRELLGGHATIMQLNNMMAIFLNESLCQKIWPVSYFPCNRMQLNIEITAINESYMDRQSDIYHKCMQIIGELNQVKREKSVFQAKKIFGKLFTFELKEIACY